MHRSLRQTFVYGLTVAATQGLSFLLLPIVTNYVAPEVYGEYALTLSISALVGTLGASWVRNLSFRLFYEAKASGQSRAFFWTIAGVQAALVSLLYVPTALVIGTFTEVVPLTVLSVAGLGMLATDFYAHAVSVVRAEQQATHYAAAEISSGVLRFAATLAGLALGFRSSVLLFVAPALAAGVLGIHVARIVHRRLEGPVRWDRAVVRSLLRFGPASLPVSVSGWAERLLDRIILDRFVSRDVVGIYTANYAIADRILGGIISAVFMMAWPDILRSWTDLGKEGARDALTRGVSLYLWLTCGPAVFIAVFNEDLARLLGREYRGGSAIIPVIVAATWLSGFNSYLNRHFELTKQFAPFSMIALGGAAVNLVVSLLLVPRLGAMGSALATLANYVSSGVVFWSVRDRELVRLPAATIVNVGLLLTAGLLLSRIPDGGVARPAAFVVTYAAGAAYFVSKRFWSKQVSVA